MEEDMRVMSQAEISRCTRGELHALLRVIAGELPRLAENSAELRAAHAALAEMERSWKFSVPD